MDVPAAASKTESPVLPDLISTCVEAYHASQHLWAVAHALHPGLSPRPAERPAAVCVADGSSGSLGPEHDRKPSGLLPDLPPS